MRRAISILTVANLLFCPIMCGREHVSDGAEGKIVRHACDCCGGEGQVPSGTDANPAKHAPTRPGHGCECICGGAIVNDANLHGVLCDWNWALPVALTDPDAAQTLSDCLTRSPCAPWPDVGKNHGRILCCLYSTLQC